MVRDRAVGTAGTAADPQYASATNFSLKAGVEYTIKLAVHTTRSSGSAHSALELAAASLSLPSAPLIARNLAWWSAWWNMSWIDLGPHRVLLESFYYGAHYMLGCFAREGGLAAGLLGPWSLQDPVVGAAFLPTSIPPRPQ